MRRAQLFAVAVIVVVGSCSRNDAAPPAPSASAGLPAAFSGANAGLGEASAVVVLGDGRFLVADDGRGVKLVEASGAVRLLLPLDDIEGLCALPDGRYAAVAERSGVVTAFSLDGRSESLGTLAHPPAGKSKKNMGWEGIAFLPAAVAHDKRDHLVAAHEGAPKAIAVFAWPSLAPESNYALTGALDTALADLSDVFLDVKSGELLLLSDESRRLLRATLSATGVTERERSAIELPLGPHEKPEGVAIDGAGTIWIVTDATSRLIRLPSR
jgi:uncharacterized protein YjiK